MPGGNSLVVDVGISVKPDGSNAPGATWSLSK